MNESNISGSKGYMDRSSTATRNNHFRNVHTRAKSIRDECGRIQAGTSTLKRETLIVRLRFPSVRPWIVLHSRPSQISKLPSRYFFPCKTCFLLLNLSRLCCNNILWTCSTWTTFTSGPALKGRSWSGAAAVPAGRSSSRPILTSWESASALTELSGWASTSA